MLSGLNFDIFLCIIPNRIVVRLTMDKHRVDYTKWKLKCINQNWFLDIDGKLKFLDILKKSRTAQLIENVIFTDNVRYQITEESDGDISIREIENVTEIKRTKTVKVTESKEVRTKHEGVTNYTFEEISVSPLNRTRNESLKRRNERQKADKTVVEGAKWFHNDTKASSEEMTQEFGSEEYVKKDGRLVFS
ncbi:uncharacterized protein LOC132725547 [Ruditapes philippinarum]|uniref:uncharacterized protein LOC132725547 n=1 Tax=Ruditapes philippinarum TaxID=129788 RepID=UPI00295BEEB9|nr:uncharacterized protein LOC132725547 [Ruditapes philippinarum]XP_060566666.1 uncharacterized protein LOC132725547 [Ruditapes philippinarum]